MGRDRAAEVAGEQERAERSSAREQIDGEAGEFQNPDAERQARAVAEPRRGIHGRGQLEHLDDAVEEQEEGREGADGPPNPDARRGDRGRVRSPCSNPSPFA